MKQMSYSRHRYPISIFQHAVRLYFRFPSSFRDIKNLLAEIGVDELVRSEQGYYRMPAKGSDTVGQGTACAGISPDNPRHLKRVWIRRHDTRGGFE